MARYLRDNLPTILVESFALACAVYVMLRVAA